ncbi:quinolinate synthase NadA [Terriglobus aquaticus]|uniref:Quinolinate synthase n=1 Tax=Terriglobus aquaticus TaxID=940139 RepID=A0ABW9KNW0_9BACT|nr:quinolinate synthase NadA [Terriglobus aquaticus]
MPITSDTSPLVVLNLPDPATGTQVQTCSAGLDDGPWEHDAEHGYGPGASIADRLPQDAPRQGLIPLEYRRASPAELDLRIRAARHALGERVVLLGHFYQRDEIVQYADFVGDSFQLAQAARTKPNAEAIVFCGVHFMAETADILARPEQAVILPNLAAGCSMADMADIDTVQDCWEELTALYGDGTDANGRAPIVPVTYMNSAANLKAFCGEQGGVVCTSSNADRVLRWAFERGERVLFFPDQHLGRNTGVAMGIPLDEMIVWHPDQPLGGNTPEQLRKAKIILWHGFCSVHKRFTVDQIAMGRQRHPGVRVIVHPECTMEVVNAADEAGSTDYIRKAVQGATEPTTFAIGTEINLVQRLAKEHPQHTIFCLDSIVCPCSTMYRIHPSYLAWVLEALERGEVLNRITVPENIAAPARIALERMLALAPQSQAVAR